MSFIGQNTTRAKQFNRSLVFQTLIRLQSTTRQEIASNTKLTPATITNIVNEFMSEGIVSEAGSRRSESQKAGRKTMMLDLNERARLVAGIHIRSDRVELGIVTLKGNVIAEQQFWLPDGCDQHDFLRLLKDELTVFLRAHEDLTVAAIGIGSVGLVDFERGVLLEAKHLGWNEVALVNELQAEYAVPVYLDHNVRGMALGEKLFGSCKTETDFLSVYMGQGIGAGMYVNDQIYRSDVTGAGELGHATYQPEGEPCWCGNHGCLERYASEEAILSEWGIGSVDELLKAYADGDAQADRALRQAGKQIGIVLTSFVNMFHVNRIIIGGRLAQENTPLLAEVDHHVNTRSFLARKRDVIVSRTSLGEQLGVTGAASVALLYGVISLEIN
ncbi:ROK family transcriptional regulator [Thalassobacillus sp. CUG 92003]|uniref:ROK family transcriptional regulator n=1 Tax=Thalassobacillus sp. CUG 92003 TaxID=2736641 RepID=UPI0015E674E0|nr:ROK family transcriptional regulator [Thalassobacillus sp. CUG 92003]